jgi:HlyD family secretion protein
MSATKGDASRRELERELAGASSGKRWWKRLAALAVVAATVGGLVFYRMKNAPPPPPRFVVAALTEGEIVETVQSTGQVKPVTEVQVGAQVSGRINRMFVDFNSVVKAGDVLAEIDPSLFSAQLDSTSAQLAAATAAVKRAEANLEAARLRLDRAKRLSGEQIGSQADVDAAQGAYDVTIADVAAARAQVAQVSAQLRQGRTNLEFTKILSPIDGVVVSRNIDAGQTVQASFQAPVLFVLAQDLRKMRVFADVDESDVGRLREGMKADVTVDAFQGVTFSGQVVQVRLSPVMQQGVVTYAAVIDVENPDLKLRPGMTATVTIRTAEAKNVRRVPNAALRFRPSPPLDDNGKPVPQEPLSKLEAGKGRVWVLVDETPGNEKVEPKIVDVGITDGVWTELTSDLASAKIVRDETDAVSTGKPKRRGMF